MSTEVNWKEEGYEEVDESGGPLWELQRGLTRYKHIIKDVRISPDRKTLWVKIEPKDQNP